METETAPKRHSRVDRQAVTDAIPLLIPAIPFGFVLGLAMTKSAMPLWAAALTSPLIFAGAAQLTMVTIAGTASLWAIISAVLVINSRHVMYSAALAPTFRAQPKWFRWVGPFMLIDQIFALAVLRSDRDPDSFRRYYLTTMLLFAMTWNVAVPLGMVIGPTIPEAWRLDFAPVIMFAGLALFAIKRVPAGIAALVGGFVSLLAAGLSDRLGILVGAICGVVAGAIAEQQITGSAPALETSEEANP
ncbi:MAG: putative branched-subunit amino acid permease [Ilumatobacter sp.]